MPRMLTGDFFDCFGSRLAVGDTVVTVATSKCEKGVVEGFYVAPKSKKPRARIIRADEGSKIRRLIYPNKLVKISDRAVPATDGKPGGPGEEDSASSPPSAGPPGAVTFPRVKLTLELAVDLNMSRPPGLRDAISDIFADYRDGRKPYWVEQVEFGLKGIVEQAVVMAVEARCREVHGNEMKQLGGGSSVSVACLEAERETSRLSVRVRDDIVCSGAAIVVEDSLSDSPPGSVTFTADLKNFKHLEDCARLVLTACERGNERSHEGVLRVNARELAEIFMHFARG